jgi:tetratricopeptide (TPR) repeat protein
MKPLKLLLSSLLVLSSIAILQVQAKTLDEVVNEVLATNNLGQVVNDLFNEKRNDLPYLNQLRLRLKAKGGAEKSVALFKKLYAKDKNNRKLAYNAALAYIDNLAGRGLVSQGYNASRSLDILGDLLEANPEDWIARYIRGMNYLHWPKWFRKTKLAKNEFLTCIEQSKRPDFQFKGFNPGEQVFHLAYIGLSDAYVLLGSLEEAQNILQQAYNRFGAMPAIKQRQKLNQQQLTDFVKNLRSLDSPIDTSLEFLWKWENSAYTLELITGKLYGPGSLEDQTLNPGALRNLYLKPGQFLEGTIKFFNNHGKEPNVPGEILQGLKIDGKLSDGTLINENVDVGRVFLMNGRFNMLLAAVGGGPNEGGLTFFLDKWGNWNLQDDAGVDPGFPEGVIKMNNFKFSTNPRILPFSKQTQLQYPAGIDRAGSIASNSFVEGYLGDDDFDGYLDGRFNVIGTFPFTAILLPGAPYAQTRTFQSNIPVDNLQTLYLTLSNLNSYLYLTDKIEQSNGEDFARLVKIIRNRGKIVLEHTKRTAPLFENSAKNLAESWQAFKFRTTEMKRIIQGEISVSDIETLKLFLAQQIGIIRQLILANKEVQLSVISNQ